MFSTTSPFFRFEKMSYSKISNHSRMVSLQIKLISNFTLRVLSPGFLPQVLEVEPPVIVSSKINSKRYSSILTLNRPRPRREIRTRPECPLEGKVKIYFDHDFENC